MRRLIVAFALLALVCVLGATCAQDQVPEEMQKWGELAQLFVSQGFSESARHDWDSIDVEESPFSRAEEALNTARVGRDTAVSPGITQSANFRFPKTVSPPLSSSETGYAYSRINNPNFESFERQVAAWYDERHDYVPQYPNDMVAHLGVDPLSHAHHPAPKAVSFASGMGAIAGVIGSILKSGDKMIIAHELYYEVADLGDLLTSIGDIKTVSVDVSDIEKVVDLAADSTSKILYLESASNPHGRIPDFDRLIPRIRAVNNDIIVVIDNTWTTPALFQPFRHDVDVVVESGTKYLSGKGDAVLGVAVVYQHGPQLSTAAAEDKEEVSETRRALLAQLPSKLRVWRRLMGSNPAPFNAWLVSKGLETLQMRMAHLSIKAPDVADFIQALPPVTRALHCGHHSHPHYELAHKYFRGYCGGIVTFHLPLKSDEEAEFALKNCAPFVPAPSFGEAHSLVMWPKKGSSRNFPEDEANAVPAIDGYWFRFSLGYANNEEIKRDFFRWMTRLPSLTTALASVDHDAFSRDKETGDVVFQLSKADWQSISNAPAPLFIKRQVLSDIDAATPTTVHAIPVEFKVIGQANAQHVELSFKTSRPSHVASYLSYPGKYIISAFKGAVAK